MRQTAAQPASAVLALGSALALVQALAVQAQLVLQPSVTPGLLEQLLALSFSPQAPRARGEVWVSAQQPQAPRLLAPEQALRRRALAS